MEHGETTLGGKVEGFPSTQWSQLVLLRESGREEAREILGRLVLAYWRPIYLTIRRGWNRTVEDAKDLTQEFLSRVFAGEFAADLDPARGRFRDWLHAALRHFLLQMKRDAQAIKRGGGRAIIPLEAFEGIDRLPSNSGLGEQDPTQVFEREWAREILHRAVERLRDHCARSGKERRFEIFQRHDLDPADGEHTTYAEVAETLEMTPGEVKRGLAEMRAAYREFLNHEVSEYTSDPAEARRELWKVLGTK